jgi:hypothetical protein
MDGYGSDKRHPQKNIEAGIGFRIRVVQSLSGIYEMICNGLRPKENFQLKRRKD